MDNCEDSDNKHNTLIIRGWTIMRRILRPFSATVSGPPLSPWQVSVPCRVEHLEHHHRHDPDTDLHHAHLSPGTQLAGGGGGAKEAAALLARRAQHLGKENMM